jgi:predicted nucleic acid-binding protein
MRPYRASLCRADRPPVSGHCDDRAAYSLIKRSGKSGAVQYGLAAAEKAGKTVDHIRQTIEQAEEYTPAEINRHTAEAYADVKSRMAAHYINIGSKTPRCFEDWQTSASSKTLQVDENDLWLVSQAVERNYILMTTDSPLVDRFTPVIPELRCQLIS